MSSFRWSARTPDTKALPHAGKQQAGMDAFDLEAMRASFAINRASATRRVARALVRSAQATEKPK